MTGILLAGFTAIIVAIIVIRGRSKKFSSPAPNKGWEVGPIINGRNYSVGSFVSLNVITTNGKLHQVTRAGKPKGSITLDITVEGEFVNDLGGQATLSMFVQRKDDDWVTLTNRFYYPLGKLQTGRFTAPLTGEWHGVDKGVTSLTHPKEFADTIANAERIGFVCGGGTGLGHGIAGSGKITINGFNA